LKINWSKNFDKRLYCKGDFSLGKFNVTLDCFCRWPIRTLAAACREIPMTGPMAMVLSSVQEKHDIILPKSVPSHEVVKYL